MLRITIIVGCLFAVLNCSALDFSRSRVDSLLEASKSVSGLPKEVDLLNEVADLYSSANLKTEKDSSIIFCNKALNLAKKIGYENGQAFALYIRGKFEVGVSGNMAAATKYLLESLDIYQKTKDKKGISKCYMQLGVISYVLQYYEDATKNLKLSLAADNNPVATYLIALSYTELDSFAIAKKYFANSISSYLVLDDKHRLNECYMFLGRLFLKTNELDSAYYYLNKTLINKKQESDSSMLIRPYAFMAELYYKKGDLDKAMNYAELSYKLEQNKNTGSQDHISAILVTKILNEAYEIKGDYNKAYKYLKLHNAYSNTFAEGSTKQKVADMQSMFEFEQEINLQKLRQQKDKEIAQTQIAKERVMRNAVIIASVLMLTLLIVLYNQYRIKQQSNHALRDLNKVITKEKKRSDDLLLNILPEELAEELKAKGSTDAKMIQQVTVLFTDFKGFTKLAEKLAHRELVAELHECFSYFDKTMAKYHIEKIKTIGDAYMAAGGLPLPRKDSVKNTVLAALEIQDFVKKRSKGQRAGNHPLFEMRLGIHTGQVVAGIVGIKKFQYDIWGDTVNTASRMESAGEVGKVNISQYTYNLLKDQPEFVFESRGEIEVKGKGEIHMWYVELADKNLA